MTSLPVSWIELASRVGWTLLHSLWEGTLIAAILAIALVLLRGRSSQARYVASLGALGTMMIAAAVTFRIEVSAPSASKASPSGSFASVVAFPRSSAQPASSIVPVSGDPIKPDAGQPSNRLSGSDVAPRDVHKWLEPMLPSLATLWAAGVLTLSLWHVGGWVAAQRLRVLGVCAPNDHVLQLSQELARRFGMSKPVRVLVSTLAQTPMIIGWLSPVILLPAAIVTGFTPKQLEGILAHELAHVRRHDYLLNLFQVSIETLFFYHPAIWWMSRRVRLEREQCCDEAAVAACGDRYAYVESLAALEEVRLIGSAALAAGGSSGRELIHRIRRLLGVRQDPTLRNGRAITAAAAWLLVVLMAVAGLGMHGSAATARSIHPTSMPTTVPSMTPALLLVTNGNYFLERAAENLGMTVLILSPADYEG